VHDKPTVAVASAFLKHASKVDVIKDHGYICAAICNGSEVRVWGCSSIDVWFILVSKEDRVCIAHTGVFCAHVVGSVTVVELSLVTLIRPESEPLEGVLETEDASLTDDFVVEWALAVRDGLLDGFNGLDVRFLPDERSAKEQCIVEVCTTIGGWLAGHAEKAVFKLRSQTGLFTRRGLRASSKFATMSFLVSIFKPLVYISLPIILVRSIAASSPVGRYYTRMAVYVGALLTVGSCSIVIAAGMSLFGRSTDVNSVVAWIFYAVVGRALDLKVEVEGESNLNTRPAIFMVNHQSILDVLVIGR
jgi:hypothetical protein